MAYSIRNVAFLLLAGLMLSGCSSWGAGSSEEQTDPFTVFNYPPLTTPPDLFLRPPLAARPPSDAGETTKAALGLETEDDAQATLSPGEVDLLNLLGVKPTAFGGGE